MGQLTLQQMSKRGNGVFQAVTNGQIANLSLGGLDYTSLASQNVMKNFYVQSMTSPFTPSGRVRQATATGCPTRSTTGPHRRDESLRPGHSDGDCFSDQFEVTHKTSGFNPVVPDSAWPLAVEAGRRLYDTWTVTAFSNLRRVHLRDQFRRIMDSDFRRASPTGSRCATWLQPADALTTSPGHGDTDLADGELWTGRSSKATYLTPPWPTRSSAWTGWTIATKFTATTQPNGSVCYDYLVSNVRMYTTPASSGVDGYNLYKMYFGRGAAEHPRQGLRRLVHGLCLGPRTRLPATAFPPGRSSIWSRPANWVTPDKLINYPIDYVNRCAGTAPGKTPPP